MVDVKAIHKYHKRVDSRLAARGIKFDGNRWEENEHPRDKDGKFTSGSGSSGRSNNSEKRVSGGRLENSAESALGVKLNAVKNSKKYVGQLSKAKKSLPEEQAPWRVTSYDDGEQFDNWHPGAKKYCTEGGSTIAVTPEGDIVGVCHHDGDPVRGKELLEYAVKNGGNKLDAYEGLFGFYTKCGFEPVSWCKWDENFAPSDWKKGRDNPENIIFYKYTGEKSKFVSTKEFFEKVKADNDYDAAQKRRDSEIRG